MTESKNTPADVILPVVSPVLAIPLAYEERWYWLGVLPSCPLTQLTVGGLAWNVYTETIHRLGNGLQTTRVRHPGCVIPLTEEKLRFIAEILPRKILRPNIVDSGAGLEGPTRKSNKAIIVTIPTEEQAAAVTRSGVPAYRKFVPRYGDRPLAEYLYLEPVEEDRPAPRELNHTLPEPIATTGIRLSKAPPVGPTECLHGAGNVLPNYGRTMPRGGAIGPDQITELLG